jgi:membrane protease YdiL (CAAX protease family)
MELINDLTKPVSKRLLLLLLIVTVGSEKALYLSRYSYFFSEIYDSIMIVSIFLAWKLHPRLMGRTGAYASGTLRDALGLSPVEPGGKKSFWHKGYISQFAAVFLLFNMASAVVNFYSYILFPGFNDNYQEYVEESIDTVQGGWVSFADDEGIVEPNDTNLVLEWFDFAGYDFYTSALAGFEEVYRLGYMILFLLLFKKFLPLKWRQWPAEVFLMAVLFLSSILFGIGHALDTPQPWDVTIGTIVTFTNMGLILGILLLWSRNLWLLIAVHGVYDVLMTIEWYYYEAASVVFSGVILAAWALEAVIRKISSEKETDIKVSQ